FVQALSTERDLWLAIAVVFATLAIGIRLTGLVLPVAMSVVLLFFAGPWGRQHFRFLAPLVALALLATMIVWRLGHTQYVADLSQIPNAPQNRVRIAALYGTEFLPQMQVETMVFVASTLGLAMLPLSFGTFIRQRLFRTFWMVMVLAMCTIATLWLHLPL